MKLLSSGKRGCPRPAHLVLRQQLCLHTDTFSCTLQQYSTEFIGVLPLAVPPKDMVNLMLPQGPTVRKKGYQTDFQDSANLL